MALDCNNAHLGLETLLSMCLRSSGNNYTLDIEEVSVPDYCAQYQTCNGETPMDAIRKLFFQRSEHCWAIRGVIQSGDCTPFFTCDNIGLGLMTAVASSLTADADGNPVMRFSAVSQSAELTCDSSAILSLIYQAFAWNGNCASVRLISKAPDANCSSIACDSMAGLTTYLNLAIGMGGDACAAFFYNLGVGELNDCSIPDLMAGFFECATPYFLVVDPTNGVNLNSLHFLWEQSDNGTTWTTVDEGDGVITAEFLPAGTPQYMRVTISCEGFTLSRTMDVSFVFQSASWSLYHWMKYSINGSAYTTLSPTAVFWLAEGDTITIHNPNNSILDSTYEAGTFFGGPDRTITKDTATNNTLYQEVGTITVLDNVTFPGDGCQIQLPYEVHFVPIPIAQTPTNVICSGSFATLTAQYGANTTELYTSYQWYKNNVIIPGATSKTYNATTAGTYKCVCTHHAKTVTSNNIVLTVQTQFPTPVLSFTGIDGTNSFIQGGTVYVQSDMGPVYVHVADSGFYSGGYPAGTTVYIAGLMPFPIDVVDFNGDLTGYNLLTGSVGGDVIVALPNSMGGCTGSVHFEYDNGTIQQAQVCDSEEVIQACVGGVGGVPGTTPPDSNCGWFVFQDTCFSDGNAKWSRLKSNCFDGSCNDLGPDRPLINVVDNGNGTWTLSTTGIGVVCGTDFSTNPVWTKIVGAGNITVNSPLNITVDAPGVYGFKGGSVGSSVCFGTPCDLVAFGQFNTFIN